jgi:type II secretory pathway component PulC
MKKIALIMLLCMAFVNISYGQEATSNEDPFEQLVPKELTSGTETTSEKTEVQAPALTVEGILWGTSMPQVIINGEVYKTGDSLKNMDGKVYKIEKDSVFVFYSGRLFEMSVSKKKEEAQ